MIILNLSSAGRGDSFPFLTAVSGQRHHLRQERYDHPTGARHYLLAVVRGGPVSRLDVRPSLLKSHLAGRAPTSGVGF